LADCCQVQFQSNKRLRVFGAGRSIRCAADEKALDQTETMTKVSDIALRDAVQQFAHLDMKAKEAVCDEIFMEQPNLLASVLVLTKMSASPLQIGAALEILIVTHLALKEAGVRIVKITEDEQEKQLRRLSASIKYTSGMEPHLVNESIRQYVGFREEPWLLSYAFARMQGAEILKSTDENSKHLALSTLNIVGCIANAKQMA